MSDIMIQSISQAQATSSQGGIGVVPVPSTVPNTGTSAVSFLLVNTYNVGVQNIKVTAKLSPSTPNPSITVGAASLPQDSLGPGAIVAGSVKITTANTVDDTYIIDLTVTFEFDAPPTVPGITFANVS